MQIPGKLIAHLMKEELAVKIARLNLRKIHAHLAVVIIGSDAASNMYIQQKKKTGESLGISVSVYSMPATTSHKDLTQLTDQLNTDASVHGIIIQRPVPITLSDKTIHALVDPRKDVDGFHPVTPFTSPVASAVLRILKWTREEIEKNENLQPVLRTLTLLPWLRTQHILIIGRGVTAGKPIQETFTRHSIPFAAANSKTTHLEEICKQSTIIISCVGKSNIVRHHMISPETVLIGVGLHDQNGQLAPDYNQEEIARTAGYFTPVPGGVGPVNVACLLENVVLAAENQCFDS